MDLNSNNHQQSDCKENKSKSNSSSKFNTTSCLNSVLRILPLQAATKKSPKKTQTIDRKLRAIPSTNSTHSQSNSGSSAAQGINNHY